MKNLITSLSTFILLTGCASMEWRDVYNEENPHNLKISNLSENKEIEGVKSASFKFNFNSDDYVYPYKIEKFYHVLHMLDSKTDKSIRDIHAPYTIIKKESKYVMIVEFKDNKSVLDVINYLYEKTDNKNDIDLKSSVDGYQWDYINNKTTNMYKLTLTSDKVNKSLNMRIDEFDKINDSLENY
jgi:hypothetical protein